MVDRIITFDGHTGDIVVVSPDVTHVFTSGVVLLTPAQATEAVSHGWEMIGGTLHECACGLCRVRR